MLHMKLFWVLVTATTSLASTSGTTVTVVTTSVAFTVTDTHLMISADPSVFQSGNNIIISTPVVSYTMTPAVSNTAAADPQSSSDDSSSSVEIIAGCVIGVVICITLLLVVIILLWCYLRRRKGKLDVLKG